MLRTFSKNSSSQNGYGLQIRIYLLFSCCFNILAALRLIGSLCIVASPGSPFGSFGTPRGSLFHHLSRPVASLGVLVPPQGQTMEIHEIRTFFSGQIGQIFDRGASNRASQNSPPDFWDFWDFCDFCDFPEMGRVDCGSEPPIHTRWGLG